MSAGGVDGMVIGMAGTRKVTVTLPVSDVAAIQELISLGQANSLSGFVSHAVRVSLDDVTGWRHDLAMALAETGGPLTRAESDWARAALGITKAAS